MLEHGGGIFGYVCHVIRVPEERLFVAILSNNGSPSKGPEPLALHIAAKALGKPLEERKGLALDEKTLDEYVGVYRFDDDATRTVTREGAKLFAQRSGGEKFEILAMARDDFAYVEGRARLRFRRDAQGKVTGADFSGGDGPDASGTKADAPLPSPHQAIQLDPAVYDDYAGEYEMRPGFTIVVSREGNQIFAQATRQPKAEIFPESPARFFLKEVDAQLEFVRGEGGKVTEMVLHQGGREMRGKKQ